MTRIGKRDLPDPLTPREVRERRLLPYEIIERWGYETNRYGTPNYPPSTEMHPQMRSEYLAAQQWCDESERNGTLKADYPQLFRSSGPSGDLVSTDGLTVHAWQL